MDFKSNFMKKIKRDGFGSKFGIIAAAAGSAVGLGNIYRFPCELGDNGGAAFLLVYLAIVLVLGVPVMLSELVIGRRSQSDAVGSFKKLAPKTAWPIVGYMGVACGFIILSFYSTISGWTLEYIYKSLINGFQGKDLTILEKEFSDFHNMGWKNVMWQSIFIFLTGFVVFKGIKKGIEQGIEQGIERGIERGIEQGTVNARMKFVFNLINDYNFSVEDAIRASGADTEERNVLLLEVERLLGNER